MRKALVRDTLVALKLFTERLFTLALIRDTLVALKLLEDKFSS